MEASDLHALIEGCRQGKKDSQKKLFIHMYNYGMSVASRYSNCLADAEEIANEGFYKMLNKIETYKDQVPFKYWVRRIIINCAIDRYRKEKASSEGSIIREKHSYNVGETKMEAEDLLNMVQCLTPKYRMVFSMYCIDGFSHEEIAKKLNISPGTSKSNLSRAREKLKQMLRSSELKVNEYGG